MYRRQFLNRAASMFAGSLTTATLGKTAFLYSGAPWQGPRRQPRQKVAVRQTAKNLIFVFLDGGASHVDTFDLKLRPETPNTLGAQNIGGLQWPSGIMSKLASLTQKFSLVRSLSAVEAVHERASYHLTTAHRHNASLVAEIPHFASAMSYMLQTGRKPQDTLPAVVMFGESFAKNGFVPIEHRGLELDEEGQIPNLRSYHPPSEIRGRFQMLDTILPQAEALKDRRQERVRLQQVARRMMDDSQLLTLLGPPDEDETLGEGSGFRRQCEAVVRLLRANKGTRFIQMKVPGWDNHQGIYQANELPAAAAVLDDGLAYLLTALEQAAGNEGGATLLDETLVVVASEFGRTTDGLNESAGRDHFPYVMSALFAGGGVKPGRVIGQSDPTGSFIVDQGWRHNRYMGISDLVATMYSALGIDWTQTLAGTPSGRPFELIPTVRDGVAYEIDSLFV